MVHNFGKFVLHIYYYIEKISTVKPRVLNVVPEKAPRGRGEEGLSVDGFRRVVEVVDRRQSGVNSGQTSRGVKELYGIENGHGASILASGSITLTFGGNIRKRSTKTNHLFIPP